MFTVYCPLLPRLVEFKAFLKCRRSRKQHSTSNFNKNYDFVEKVFFFWGGGWSKTGSRQNLRERKIHKRGITIISHFKRIEIARFKVDWLTIWKEMLHTCKKAHRNIQTRTHHLSDTRSWCWFSNYSRSLCMRASERKLTETDQKKELSAAQKLLLYLV